MSVHVEIVEGPLGAMAEPLTEDGRGATLVFDGVVRGIEGDREIVALDYEAYEPMASKQLRALSERLVHEHGLLSLWCWHSTGRVGVGEVSFRLAIVSRHRREALDAMDAFIDEMKRGVPIWKSPVYA